MNATGPLFRKYMILIAGLVSAALLASGLIDFYFLYQEQREGVAALQREKALRAAAKIEQFIKEIEAQVEWVSQTPIGARVKLEDRNMDYSRLLRHAAAIAEIRYLDGAGHEQIKISRVEMDAAGSSRDASLEPLLRQTGPGRTYFGAVYFRKESEPYMTIAVRGKGKEGDMTVAEVNLKLIWDVVSQITIGASGHAYVVDGRSQLIAHPDISLVLRKTDLSALPQIQRARAVQQSSEPGRAVMVARDREDRQVLTAFAPVAPLGWFVFVDLPLAEAFAPLYASLYRCAALVIAGIGLSVIASLFLARRMVKPIRTIQEAAGRFGAGVLDQRIELRTGDELEALADTFNNMAERLRELYGTLEQKVAERTQDLALANEKLKVLDQLKSDFVANVSHELRTPLTAIKGAADLLLRETVGPLGEKQTHYLNRIRSNTQHLAGLINDLLDLSKIEAGKSELAATRVSLDGLVHEVLETLRPLAAEKVIALEADASEPSVLVWADRDKIAQVLMNIIGNAIKFTPAQGRITVSTQSEGKEWARVSITDTGPGVRAEEREKIFEKFYQAGQPGAHKPKGTGLGLAISKALVELHGGKIWVEPESSRGSTFTFVLPLSETGNLANRRPEQPDGLTWNRANPSTARY